MYRFTLIIDICMLLVLFTSLFGQDLIREGEQGEYEIFIGGEHYGYLNFKIEKGDGNAFTVTGESDITTPNSARFYGYEAEITGNINYKKLNVHIQLSGAQDVSAVIECVFSEDDVHVLVEGVQSAEKTLSLKPDYVVLGNNRISEFYFILKKFLNQREEKKTYQALSPDIMDTFSVILERVGNEVLQLGESEYKAIHCVMSVSGQKFDLWGDAESKALLKVEMAAQNVEIVLKTEDDK